MNLINTTIGELYLSLSTLEVKRVDGYIQRNGNAKTLALHRLLVKIKNEKGMKTMCYEDVKKKLYRSRSVPHSSFTTDVHLLQHHIKECLLLSKINEKNIYTEVLWGEMLIERQLKRNLLIKIKNYQFDLYKDQYALLKNFYHKREVYFYQELMRTKKNFTEYIDSIIEKIHSFDLFVKCQRLEMFTSYYTQSKQVKNESILDINIINKELNDGFVMENDIVKIQSYILSLSLYKDLESFIKLEKLFYDKYDYLSLETITQVFPTLLNYGITKYNQGNEEFSLFHYKLLNFIYHKNDFFKQGIFAVTRFYLFIISELKHGQLEQAEKLLIDNIDKIPQSHRVSFENLLRSTFEFSKQNYKDSLRYISNINSSDSIYYFPLYKIMLIKCYIMLSDIERLMAERDNFGKYLTNNKKHIPEAVQMRHKLFIRYAEYLTEARYEYLTGYMKKRIETALFLSSPYFSEKEWVRERWHDLKLKFQESE